MRYHNSKTAPVGIYQPTGHSAEYILQEQCIQIELPDICTILFSPFAVRQTGIICNRCKLQLNDVSFAVAPYMISKTETEILVSLTPRERTFFTNFYNKICILSLSFEDTSRQTCNTVPTRGKILSVKNLQDNGNIFIIRITFINCPPGIVTILNDYLEHIKELEQNYVTFKNRFIYIDTENSNVLPIKTISLLVHSKNENHISIYKFSTQQIVFLAHEEIEYASPDTDLVLRLYCGKCSFDVSGYIESVKSYTPDALCIIMHMNFSPEFTEIVTRYFAQVRTDITYLESV